MKWKDKYDLAVRLASIYSWEYPRDIAHDAWISYMKSTGNDLFGITLDGYNYYLSRIIRRSFLRWLRREHIFSPTGGRYVYFGVDELESGIASPEEALFGQDLYELLLTKLKENQATTGRPPSLSIEEIFTLKASGYTQSDIALSLGVNKDVISKYNKKMSFTNPFNGSKLKISRIILKDTWNEKDDQEDYEQEDYNEYYELYRHKESGQGLLVRLNSSVKPKRNSYVKSHEQL